MTAHLRHQLILDTVRDRKSVSVAELCRLLKASPATVRRDVDQLEGEGCLIRTHGAIVDPQSVANEPAFSLRSRESLTAKRAIALLADHLVPDGSTVFVDAGTTPLEAGRRLASRSSLTLVTNSLPLLSLPLPPRARLIAVGGEYRPVSRALVGAGVSTWFADLHCDVALLGASGLDPAKGASTTEFAEAAVKKAAAANASRVLVLADAAKWRKPAAVRFLPWSDIDGLVSDAPPSAQAVESLSAQGVALHLPSPIRRSRCPS